MGATLIDLIDGYQLCDKLKELRLGVDTKLTKTMAIRTDRLKGYKAVNSKVVSFVTADGSLLNGWALYRTIAAKHTAIPRFGLDKGVAVGTGVEVLTGIGGHRFPFLEATMGTSDDGF